MFDKYYVRNDTINLFFCHFVVGGRSISDDELQDCIAVANKRGREIRELLSKLC